MRTVRAATGAVIAERDPDRKALAVRRLADDWAAGRLDARPAATDVLVDVALPRLQALAPLIDPRAVPRRRVGSAEGRAAMLHAVAHIEWTAIDLALDHAHRFAGLPDEYYGDWLGVASEEALHLSLLRERLTAAHGIDYGDLPAHAGQWSMAERTAGDVLARMALVPRVNEARGLDVAPGIAARLAAVGDHESAAVLHRIEADEVGHVAVGDRWFRHLCAERGLEPEATFAALLAEHGVRLRPPANVAARLAAGFTERELGSLGLLG